MSAYRIALDAWEVIMWDPKYNNELVEKREKAKLGGGKLRIEKQHALGKLTARERIDYLFDKGSFIEVDAFIESRSSDFDMEKKRFLGDGVITGYGNINGRLTFASSEDFTVIGGSLGEFHSLKICRIMDMALNMRAPFISINDSGGARIEEGICSLSGYSGIFLRNTIASGIIPQIAAIMGPCAGGACYSPAICDYIFMVDESSQMFITGPQVIKATTGEVVTGNDLGGTEVHTKVSGNVHFSFKNEIECLKGIRELLSYLPQSNTDNVPVTAARRPRRPPDLTSIISDNQRRVYDIHSVIKCLADDDSFLEVQENFARNVVVGFARVVGKVIGIIANQPNNLAGALDCDASDKAARFIRFCDCYNIPLLTLIDVPGYLPGIVQEHAGIIRHGAKLLYAYSEATVPKVSLILRKAFGGAYIAMNSKHMGADLVYAWPISQIAVMGAEGAVPILFHKQLAEATDKEAENKKLIRQYEGHFMNPYIAAQRGYVDEVILPEETRDKIIKAFEMLKTKHKDIPWKKHGNIPL